MKIIWKLKNQLNIIDFYVYKNYIKPYKKKMEIVERLKFDLLLVNFCLQKQDWKP